MDLSIIFNIFQILFISYFGFVTLYLFIYATASFFYKPKSLDKAKKYRKFLVLIPAYKEDIVIINVAKDVLNQDYPKEFYDVYVIADQLKDSTISSLREIPVNVLKVFFEISSKAKSINEALKIAGNGYDGVVVLDADNLMDTNFITRANEMMDHGSIAIQGHRIAKNLDTNFSILDAISEEINNSIFRKGHVVLGLSSAMIGSGMAIDYDLFFQIMEKADTFAEDKELEFKIILQKKKIDYLHDVFIYDEKVSKPEVFVKQRSRWLAFQLIYAKRFFVDAFVELILRKNVDFWDKVMQQILPPRIILLGLTIIINILSLLFNSELFKYAWAIQGLLCLLAITFAIPKRFFNRRTLFALLSLPLGFILMFKSLFRYEKAKINFEPTPHTHTKMNTGNSIVKTKNKQ